MYEVELTEAAYNDIERLREAGEFAAIRKIDALIYQLQKHPFTGTGKPEPLMGDKKGQWSRRIIGKHRLTYSVSNEKITVIVISAYGHYDDK
jgi:toxin-antitoxin system, toxin component, Txe/YoeB family